MLNFFTKESHKPSRVLSFNLYFLFIVMLSIFMCLLGMCISLFVKYMLKLFAYFNLRCLVFLSLSCKSSLYIQDTSPLSAIYIANIFSL